MACSQPWNRIFDGIDAEVRTSWCKLSVYLRVDRIVSEHIRDAIGSHRQSNVLHSIGIVSPFRPVISVHHVAFADYHSKWACESNELGPFLRARLQQKLIEKLKLLLWDLFYISFYVDLIRTGGRGEGDPWERVIEWGRVVDEQGHTENVKGQGSGLNLDQANGSVLRLAHINYVLLGGHFEPCSIHKEKYRGEVVSASDVGPALEWLNLDAWHPSQLLHKAIEPKGGKENAWGAGVENCISTSFSRDCIVSLSRERKCIFLFGAETNSLYLNWPEKVLMDFDNLRRSDLFLLYCLNFRLFWLLWFLWFLSLTLFRNQGTKSWVIFLSIVIAFLSIFPTFFRFSFGFLLLLF